MQKCLNCAKILFITLGTSFRGQSTLYVCSPDSSCLCLHSPSSPIWYQWMAVTQWCGLETNRDRKVRSWSNWLIAGLSVILFYSENTGNDTYATTTVTLLFPSK